MTELHNEIERFCVDSGAMVAYAHHQTKGSQSGKFAIDRPSGSGVFARDPDTIITITALKEPDCFRIDVFVRNLPPVESFGVRWDFPLMVRDDELELDEIAEPGASHEKKWSDEEFLATLNKKGARAGDWIAGEIDQKNGWFDSIPTKLEEARETAIEASAKGVRELMNFVWRDQPITKRGAMRLVEMKLCALGQMFAPEMLSASWSHRNGRAHDQQPGPPLRLRDLAKMLGVPTRELRRQQARFARQWGFRLHVRPVRTSRTKH